MAKIDDLLLKIEDEDLKARLSLEIKRMNRQKKFGLVFEDHVPEFTVLYEVPVRVGSTAKINNEESDELYTILQIKDDKAFGKRKYSDSDSLIALDFNTLVTVAEFGEAIYPYLNTIDTIETNPKSDLWHILIEADNYHALQMLEYTYMGKVDCIYIDPPYNTLDKQWKYNNHYVDSSDAYKHSKWLSLMEKRLRLAKKLLNPKDSVLVVTIDEKEYLHLGMLLEEIFPNAIIQMVVDIINPKGVARDYGFSRVEEYIYFVFMGNAKIQPNTNNMLRAPVEKGVRWASLQRSGSNSRRFESKSLFYPIFFNIDDHSFHSTGDSLPLETDRHSIVPPENTYALFPLGRNNDERTWQLSQDTLKSRMEKGYVKFGKWNEVTQKRTINYLSTGVIHKIEQGKIEIVDYDTDGSVILNVIDDNTRPMTVWNLPTHSASEYGSTLLGDFMPDRKFPYPKSLYATKDALNFVVGKKKDAIILDFFAGSGTTLHAVNLLNYEDEGNRQCIMVTNNELSHRESSKLSKKGYTPGDMEWESLGIARYITWPRTVSSIKGINTQGNALNGKYLTSQKTTTPIKRNFKHISFVSYDDLARATDKKQLVALLGKEVLPQSLVKVDSQYIIPEDDRYNGTILFDNTAVEEWLEVLQDKPYLTNFFIITKKAADFRRIKEQVEETLGEAMEQKPLTLPMSQGFESNAIYFKLGFLDKTSIALGRQFKELLPVLWMKGGATGKCPVIEEDELPDYLIYTDNKIAILINESSYHSFLGEIVGNEEITTIFIVTNSETSYREMIRQLPDDLNYYQLYRDYLDNFKINMRRN